MGQREVLTVHEFSVLSWDEKVIGVPSGKVDVEEQRYRALHKDLVFMQLGHVNIQRLTGIGFRRVESDTLDSARCLHGTRCLCYVCCSEVIWHRHYIKMQNIILIEMKNF